jgi:CHASE2 domain-containing sensor protein
MRRNKQIVKVLVYFGIFKLLFIGLALLLQQNFMQVFEIQNLGSKDFSFNDMYYRVKLKEGLEYSPHFSKKKTVVLINSGSLDRENFRYALSRVLYRLERFEPLAIGIDHTFSKKSAQADSSTHQLKEAITTTSNLVLAKIPSESQSSIQFNRPLGEVELPVVHFSIRYYKDGPQTFASKLGEAAGFEKDDYNESDGKFPIHYSSVQNGLVHWLNMENHLYDINFKYVEAPELFDTSQFKALKKILRNKIVIIGHLGSPDAFNLFDVEDKHPVPVDTNNVANRERIMPGAVIHANALENIIHPKNKFSEWKGLTLLLLTELVFLLYLIFIMFTEFGKLFNVLLLAIISFPLIYLVLFMMEGGVYVTLGVTLLQLLMVEEVLEIIDFIYDKLRRLQPSKKQKE